MRSVGPQPPTVSRPCFACKSGLNGRTYCPTCGNTNDLVGGSRFRGKPLDEQPRSSREITDVLSGAIHISVGVEYEVTVELNSKEVTTFVGVCDWKQGPFAHFSSGHNVHLLEIKRCEPCP